MLKRKFPKFIYLLACFLLIFQQSGFAQVAAQLDIAGHLNALRSSFAQDKFRPLHLRYLSYDSLNNSFKLLLDKGDFMKGLSPSFDSAQDRQGTVPIEEQTKELLKYFFIGISLPNDAFWVNLRPDAEDNIIDNELAQTDVGKIMLEADLQLKKDTALATSPETPEGKEYWDKLYKKAGEIFGSENITIPTLTRPWIVPDEIIIRETPDSAYTGRGQGPSRSAYIYKATLKVMLEQDYLKDSAVYNFKDDRLKELNEYSSQLIREIIIPKLNKEVTSSKRYASLRQVYYSLIMAQWFKARHKGLSPSFDSAQDRQGTVPDLIDSRNLTNLTSKEGWSKTTYFQAYQKSFKDGEYNIRGPVYTPYGQTIRSYFSGGMQITLGDFVPFGQPNSGSSSVLTLPANSSSPVISGSEKWKRLIPILVLSGGVLLIQGDISRPLVEKVPITKAGNQIENLQLRAKDGDSSALTVLINLASQGNRDAVVRLRKLTYDQGNTAVAAEEALRTLDITKIVQLASQGNSEAVRSLKDIVFRGNSAAAKEALRTFDTTKFVQLASQGNRDAVRSLYDITSEGNSAAFNALVTLASQGNNYAVRSLVDLAFQGNSAAINALVTLASQGNHDAVQNLYDLASISNSAAEEALRTLDITKIVQLASQGNHDAVLSLGYIAGYNQKAFVILLEMLTTHKAIQATLEDILRTPVSLPIVRRINNLHNSQDNIRFASVSTAQAALLYTLMVYGQEEIFTSSFNGLFNRLLERMQKEGLSGEQLLAKVNYNKFRIFIKLSANFNRLNEFLGTFNTPEARKQFIQSFVKDIDKAKDPLGEAVVVADMLGIIQDKNILVILQETVRSEYERVIRENKKEAKALYGLLAGMFSQKAVINIEWLQEMARKYQLANILEIPQSALVDAQGRHIEQYFFYDDPEDKDGEASFRNFISTFKNGNWRLEDYPHYIRFKSTYGTAVEIYANKPQFEKKGQEEINRLFKERNLKPQVIVHRGHSFHANKTIETINPDTRLVYLGSCGGYNNVKVVLDKSSTAHIFSTKGMGTMVVNDPLLRAIAEHIRQGQGINWPRFKKEAETALGRNGAFHNYIFPHENLGVMFLKAYNRILEQGNAPRPGAKGSSPITDENSVSSPAQEKSASSVDAIALNRSLTGNLKEVQLQRQQILSDTYHFNFTLSDPGLLLPWWRILVHDGANPVEGLNWLLQARYQVSFAIFAQRIPENELTDLVRPHMERFVEIVSRFPVGIFLHPEDLLLFIRITDTGNHFFPGALSFLDIDYETLKGSEKDKDLEIIFHEVGHVIRHRFDFSVIKELQALYAQKIKNNHHEQILFWPKSLAETSAIMFLNSDFEEYVAEFSRTFFLHDDALRNFISSHDNVDIQKALAGFYQAFSEWATLPDDGSPTLASRGNKAPGSTGGLTGVPSLRSESTPLTLEAGDKGGIDFRTLPIVTQAMSNLRINLRDSPLRPKGVPSEAEGRGEPLRIDLDQEWQEIQKMVEAGITPSADRIKEYVQASCLKGNSDMQKVVSCIADILRLEEERCSSTEAMLKDILVVLESGMPNQELKQIFSGTAS